MQWLWLVATACAAIRIKDAPPRPELLRDLTNQTYRRLTRPAVRWPCNRRLNDLSLRLAVRYPILVPLPGWAATGRAMGLGDITTGDTGLLLHGTVALFALSALAPLSWRSRFAQWVSQDGAVPAAIAPLAIGGLWALCLLLPFAVLWLVWLTLRLVWQAPLGWYLSWFEWVARSLGELP